MLFDLDIKIMGIGNIFELEVWWWKLAVALGEFDRSEIEMRLVHLWYKYALIEQTAFDGNVLSLSMIKYDISQLLEYLSQFIKTMSVFS
jgi:hypothetical protein